MNRHNIFDELDQAIEQMLAEPDGEKPAVQDEVGELVDIASDLRHLPRPDFKMQLKAELEWQSWSPTARSKSTPSARAQMADASVMPTLAGNSYGLYPIHRSNFVASVLLHAAALVIFVGLGVVMAQHHGEHNLQDGTKVTLLAPYLPTTPGIDKKPGGGGGGGERSKLQTSAGEPPKTSMQAQLAPPVVERPREESKLMAEPTVVADLKVPDSAKVGDQLSRLMAPSAGPGTRAGVGSGSGHGVGPGDGDGLGPGNNYGHGGGIGGNGHITTPKLIYSPDPEFSEEARKSKHQGVVVMTVLVGTDGKVHDARVTQSLGMGLDEKAMETVKLWKFEPARASDGTLVAVYASIEVNFRLY
ncbi:MAG TPA: energy transducer TonB [Candidatus Angelobacter sp.]|jgi:TonB family protein|nr:energy transducer TonB [Candidatus Angelobacter sp.]